MVCAATSRLVVILHIDFSRGVAVGTSLSFIVGGTTDDEAAFSTGLCSELSDFGGPMSSSAAGDVNSSLKASCAQAVAIWRNAKRAALSRLSTAHRLQSPDNLQQSLADDVITPKRV
jgi:hypothetical protein